MRTIYTDTNCRIRSNGEWLYYSDENRRFKMKIDEIWNEETNFYEMWNDETSYLRYFIELVISINIKY